MFGNCGVVQGDLETALHANRSEMQRELPEEREVREHSGCKARSKQGVVHDKLIAANHFAKREFASVAAGQPS